MKQILVPSVLPTSPPATRTRRPARLIYELPKQIAGTRTVLVATHAESLAAMAERVLHIKDGKPAPGRRSSVTNDVAARNVEEALQTKR